MNIKQIMSMLFESKERAVTVQIQQSILRVLLDRGLTNYLSDFGLWFRVSGIDKVLEKIFTDVYKLYFNDENYNGGNTQDIKEYTSKERELAIKLDTFFYEKFSNNIDKSERKPEKIKLSMLNIVKEYLNKAKEISSNIINNYGSSVEK